MLKSIQDLGQGTLGVDGWSRGESVHHAPPHLPGSFITLVSPSNSVQIGFVADRENCASLARMLLGLEPDDDLEESDLADAMGEVANIVAGGVKTLMHGEDTALQLGLPIFVDGFVEPSHRAEVLVTPIVMGEIMGQSIIIRNRRNAAAA